MKIMSYRGITLFTFCAMVIVLMAGCPMLTASPAMYSPTLTAGSEQLTASWVDPTTWNWGENNAGNDITEYHLRYREDGSEGWTEITSGITGTSHTITELTNGLSYVVQVRAVNAQGTGGWSASATATPTAPPAAPGTMAAPTLYAGTGRLVATWTAPTDTGGSPITGYELQYRIGGGAWTQITEGITGTYHSITGLTNGIVYGVQMRAVNAVGAGPWSPFAIGRPLLLRTQTPAGTARVVSLSDAVNVIIASENLSVYLITGTHGVDDSGNITVNPATTPVGVTPPTVDESTGLVTVTAGTTAGTYLVYGTTGTGDTATFLFAEYFYVTESPTTKAELSAAVTTAIGVITDTNDSGIWGNTADLNYIITTALTDIRELFTGQIEFNGDISGWDVSSVTNMRSMFNYASAFNGDISRWDVSSVENMQFMFNNASAFNGDISRWDVSSVENMGDVFSFASAFNGDISGWDVSLVTNMGDMFNGASAFNGDISGWDVSSVTNMDDMFNNANVFAQDLEEWKDHLPLIDASGTYTGTKNNMFTNSGVTGDLIPSWYAE